MNAKCGNCHVRGSRGGLSMTTFAALEKGTCAGPVIRPGSAQASRLMELVATGAMPKAGNKLTPEELDIFSRCWIDAGALLRRQRSYGPAWAKVAGH